MCLTSSKHINGGRRRINRVLKIYSVTCIKTGRPTIDRLTNFAIKVVKSCSVLSHNTTFCHCKTLCLYCASTVVRFRFRIDLINSTPQKTKTKQDKTRRNSCCTVIFAPPIDASRCWLREGCTTIKCHLTRSRVYYLMENLYSIGTIMTAQKDATSPPHRLPRAEPVLAIAGGRDTWDLMTGPRNRLHGPRVSLGARNHLHGSAHRPPTPVGKGQGS